MRNERSGFDPRHTHTHTPMHARTIEILQGTLQSEGDSCLEQSITKWPPATCASLDSEEIPNTIGFYYQDASSC